MYVKDIFESVNGIAACAQPKFLAYLDATVKSLMAKYGIRRVINGPGYVKPSELSEDLPVKDEYYNAIVDNILYSATGNADYKTDYVAEAEYAYKTVWRKAAKGLRMVGKEYYDV